jgi:sugar lactone lactonase YvrE
VVLAAWAGAEAQAPGGAAVGLAQVAQVAGVAVSPGRGGRIQIDLAAPDGPRFALQLAPSHPLVPGARDVWVDGGGVIDEAPAQVFYHGWVAGDPRAWARIALRAGALDGVVWTPGEIYFLEPANRFDASAPASTTILYRLSDIGPAWEAALCGSAQVPAAASGSEVRSVHGAALYESLGSALRTVAGAPAGRAVLVADSDYAEHYGAGAASAMQDVFHVLGGLRRHLGAVPPIARTVVDGGGDRAAAVDDRPGQTTYVFDLTALSSAVLTNDCPERAGRAIETWLRAGGADQSASGGRATVPPPTPTPTPQFSNAAPLRADEVTGAAAAALNTMAQAAIGQPQLLSNALNETGPGSLFYPYDIARDPSVAQTRFYVVDSFNMRVLGYECAGANCALPSQSSASRVFGEPDFVHHDQNGGLLGTVSATTMSFPEGAAVGPDGTLFVADTGNNRVLVYQSPWTSDAVADIVLGQASMSSNAAGSALNQMRSPSGLFVDGGGVLWVADTGNNRVLKFPTIATGASAAFAIGGTGGASTTTLSGPSGVGLDAAGALYVADTGFSRVVRYAPPLTGGMAATTVFGHGGSMTDGSANQGGIGAGSLAAPERLTVDAVGRLWVADTGNNRVLEFDTPVSNQTAARVFGQTNRMQVPTFTTNVTDAPDGFVNATGFFGPRGLALDGNGTLWVAERDNSRVLAFGNPLGAAPAAVIADHVLAKPDFVSDYANIPSAQRMNNPLGVAVDRSHTPNRLWVTDVANNRVLGYASTAGIASNVAADHVLGQSSFTAGSTNAGLNNPIQHLFNAVASNASLMFPVGVAVDSLGGVYVADSSNSRVLHFLDPFATDTTADRVFGQDNFTNRNSDVPYGTASSLAAPNGVAIGPGNDLWVADTIDNRVVRFSNAPAQPTTSASADLILGQSGFVSTGVFPPYPPGCAANRMNAPAGIFAGASGRVYVADSGNHRVLVFTPPFTNGMNAAAVIGQANLTSCAANRGGAAGAATLNNPRGVFEDTDGTLFVADKGNNRVLVYDPPFGGGDLVADAVIGHPSLSSTAIMSPGPNTLYHPQAIAMDASRNLFIADGENSRVTRYALDAPPTVLLDPITDPVVIGAYNVLTGSGFTAGSVIILFVRVNGVVMQFGPYTPTNWAPGELIWIPPPQIPLGDGVAAVAVVNTDQGYIGSTYRQALLYGNASLNRPTILGINGSGLHAPDGALPVVYVSTPVYPGTEATLNGTGFNNAAVNFYTAAGNLGPLWPKVGATATQLKVDIPAGAPLGLAAFEVINSPYTGSVGSQTVYAPLGDPPTLSGVSQSGSTITVTGTGFSSGAVVIFFNLQGSGVVNLGGPGLNVTVVGPTQLHFTVPAGAVPGPCFVQVVNPPYIAFTATSSSDPHGGLILVAP